MRFSARNGIKVQQGRVELDKFNTKSAFAAD